MRKYQLTLCFGSETLEVYAVPGGDYGGEDARARSEFNGCVVAYAKAVTVVWATCVEAEARVVGLG
jgi:hypothetical protein